jgi:RNA polymerase II-associated protein 2
MDGHQTASEGRVNKEKPLLKSILKPSKPVQSPRERTRELILSHAHLIQQRKHLKMEILNSTIALLDFPADDTADPEKPTARDVQFVKRHLRRFEESDYVDLMTERVINKKCAYVLCPRLPNSEGTDAPYRLVVSGKDLRIVATKELERFCSSRCNTISQHLQAQLSEPLWERARDTELLIWGEDSRKENVEGREGVQDVTADLQRLALERGASQPDVDGMMNLTIRENPEPNG